MGEEEDNSSLLPRESVPTGCKQENSSGLSQRKRRPGVHMAVAKLPALSHRSSDCPMIPDK